MVRSIPPMNENILQDLENWHQQYQKIQHHLEEKIKQLGVSVQKDFGKGNFKFFSRIFGWKASKWTRHIYYKLR